MEIKDSPFSPDVEVELGGEKFTLCYPIPAIWKLEDLSKMDILGNGLSEDDFKAMSRRHQLEFVINLVYAGLITKHPEITVAKVGGMLFLRNMLTVQKKAMEAFTASLPSPEAEAAQKQDPLAETKPVVQ